jgi:hypothetical protein
MNCTICGQSALGVALDGKPYCHRRERCDWKQERMKRWAGMGYLAWQA